MAREDMADGLYPQATDHCQQLLTIAEESDVRNWQFEAQQGLGQLQLAANHPGAAIAHHEQALALADELNQPLDQARAHEGLAHAHWHHALNILTSLGIDDTSDKEATATAIRAHLAALAQR